MPNAPPHVTRTTCPAPTARTGDPMGTAKSWPVCPRAQWLPPLPKPADSRYPSTGVTHGCPILRRGCWNGRRPGRSCGRGGVGLALQHRGATSSFV